jgi:hypothetical protein
MTKKKTDRVSLGPQVGPNARLAMRERDGEYEPAIVGPVRDGVPLPSDAEIIELDNVNCTCGHWQDITTLYGGGDKRATDGGPAQVATKEYRDGYDRIFGKKPSVGLA